MAIQNYDVIVVGGGPAGSSCATRLVNAGLSVCVLDREAFPREKLCAGWITPQVLQNLELDPEEYPYRFNTFSSIKTHIRALHMNWNLSLKSIQHSIRRFEFDDYLLQRSGARVEQHLVRSIHSEGKDFIIDDQYRSRYLVGAGGTRCPVYRSYFKTVMPRRKDLQTTTLEQEICYDWQSRNGAAAECHLWFFDQGLPGYCWYVPKADGYLNCGLGAVSQALKGSGQTIQNYWKGFRETLSDQLLVDRYSFKTKGYSYYLKQVEATVQLGNVYIAGDAVGLATRDMGEGIGPAVISGQRVAESILSGRIYRVDDLPLLSLPDMAGYGGVASALLRRFLEAKLDIETVGFKSNLGLASQHNGGPNALQVTHSSTAPVLRMDRLLASLIKRYIGDIHVSLQLWDGSLVNPELKNPRGVLKFQDRAALWYLIRSPEIGFGESYTRGGLDIEGEFLDIFRDLAAANRRVMPSNSWRRRLIELVHRPRPNSQRTARENIHSHYDLGNEFYASWLDEQMLYTCAYYRNCENSLEQAQIDKMDYVCRKLQLQPGQSVLETGCGWGALSLHMARNYGVRVKAFNISHEQIIFARARAAKEGLLQSVEFIEDDYRNANGKFDVFVSVGMLEHVGLNHYRELGACIDRVLKADAKGLIHSIGRNRSEPNNPWIEKHIFPGSRPPSLAELMQVFEPNNFSVVDVENLRLHYARTCHDWLDRYEKASHTLAEKFDEKFLRAWRLYLTGSTTAFLSGTLQLFQVVFTRAGNNRIPWTRDYLYTSQTTHPGLRQTAKSPTSL